MRYSLISSPRSPAVELRPSKSAQEILREGSRFFNFIINEYHREQRAEYFQATSDIFKDAEGFAEESGYPHVKIYEAFKNEFADLAAFAKNEQPSKQALRNIYSDIEQNIRDEFNIPATSIAPTTATPAHRPHRSRRKR